MSNREMRVLIVGAGIAGLTLHALLQQRDIESCGIDKAALSGHAGYLLGLWPLGSHVLHGLHLFGRYVEASAPMSHYRILNEHGGTLRELSFDSISDQYGCLGHDLAWWPVGPPVGECLSSQHAPCSCHSNPIATAQPISPS